MVVCTHVNSNGKLELLKVAAVSLHRDWHREANHHGCSCSGTIDEGWGGGLLPYRRYVDVIKGRHRITTGTYLVTKAA